MYILIEREVIIVEVLRMYNFMKKEKVNLMSMTADELLKRFQPGQNKLGRMFLALILLFVVGLLSLSVLSFNQLTALNPDDEEQIMLAENPIAATSTKTNVLTIPTGIVKANPFLPYRPLGDEFSEPKLINDVPRYDLIAPPEVMGEDTAIKIMDTVVSGILFDKFSPSAILNIDGTDYLVKKGDTVHKYKVIAIAQDSVTVQLGKNTYKAGIGEILTDGTVNHNDVSNLDKKFGGEQR